MYLVVTLSSLLLVTYGMVLPEDLENTFGNLKKAEAAKDAVQVKKLAAQAHALACEAIAEPAPAGADEKDAWTKRVAYAKDIELYTEYALYSTAVQSPAAVTVDLLSALEQQNPKSKYLEQAYGRYFVALQQTGAASKIPATAEAAAAHFPDNEDLLLVLADSAFARKQGDRALRYSERLISVLGRHSRPEGITAADWERKRSAALGRAYWIAGMVYSDKTQYYKANQDLRAALPYLQGKNEMMGTALFYLGVANYQLGSQTRNKTQVLEAAKFSEQAGAMQGPLAQQAWRNAQVMKTEAAKLR